MEGTFLGLDHAKIFTFMGGHRAGKVKMIKHCTHLHKETGQSRSILNLIASRH